MIIFDCGLIFFQALLYPRLQLSEDEQELINTDKLMLLKRLPKGILSQYKSQNNSMDGRVALLEKR
jgi:hypothetical protein